MRITTTLAGGCPLRLKDFCDKFCIHVRYLPPTGLRSPKGQITKCKNVIYIFEEKYISTNLQFRPYYRPLPKSPKPKPPNLHFYPTPFSPSTPPHKKKSGEPFSSPLVVLLAVLLTLALILVLLFNPLQLLGHLSRLRSLEPRLIPFTQLLPLFFA